jgi:hypothetical protein
MEGGPAAGAVGNLFCGVKPVNSEREWEGKSWNHIIILKRT